MSFHEGLTRTVKAKSLTALFASLLLKPSPIFRYNGTSPFNSLSNLWMVKFMEQQNQKLMAKIEEKRPKRLLSIDGGGIRGILPLQILKKVESIVLKYNPSCECLGDYFDFIAGTSTGSIIATGLAIGMKIDDLLELYKDGEAIFKKEELSDEKILEYLKPVIDQLIKAAIPKGWGMQTIAGWYAGLKEKDIPTKVREILKSKNIDESLLLQLIYGWQYSPDPLYKKLEEKFGELTLGSEELKALLMIVTKNATTGQPYFFVNNPKDKEFQNKLSQVKLKDIVRASSAAPTYFPPHSFKVGNEEYEFIDGGMSTFNNPSFILFLQAVTQQFGIDWTVGEENLLMISVGTGFSPERLKWDEANNQYKKAKDYKLTDWGGYAIGVLMEDANIYENLMMKIIGKKPSKNQMTSPPKLVGNTTYIDDWEFPDVTKGDGSKWLKYRRYSCSLRTERFKQLEEKFGLKLSFPPDNREKIERINQMDCTDMIEDLSMIGAAVAKEQVRDYHFQGFTENPITG
ncbi:patatin-like phospholipase family protein [Planktothrix agardhii]|uniref:patatin-like phospholipase family protein n=1 Tax=Planktothrix agardhii TaxID=1160 RepID=UPI0020A74280|nr:patatin-like phospholipase family protein [Planktothrix agardhii]